MKKLKQISILLALVGLSISGAKAQTPTVTPMVAAGTYHSLALRYDGTVWAWGGNSYGQLGDGANTNRYCPVQAVGLTNIVAVAAGWEHSLALSADGTVYAWGSNEYGQIGDGTNTNRNTPVAVSGLTGIVAIAAGNRHSLAVKDDGTVYAWGWNDAGQLGNGATTDINTPVQVVGLTNITAVAGGTEHSLALTADGRVFAWGGNSEGQLGNGATTNSSTPVEITGFNGVKAIAAGDVHSLALKTDGTVYAWGDNDGGALGDGTYTDRHAPVQITALSNITAVAAGYMHSLALKEDGKVYAWGTNANGQLGDGTTTPRNTPTVNPFLTDARVIAAGYSHNLVIRTDGMVYAWGGDNSRGQLGDGTDGTCKTPVQIPDFTGITAVAAGTEYGMALKSNGTVWAWGRNAQRQLGDGTVETRTVPVQVNGITDIIAIAAGAVGALALKEDGTVWQWGNNLSAAAQVPDLTDITAITSGALHSFALKEDGTVWGWGAWGSNSYGQLGDGTTTDRYTPVQITALTNVIAVSAGEYHTLFLKTDGTVWASGRNNWGQLGDGTTTDRTTPVQVLNLTDVRAVTGGYNCSYAIKNDGTVWAWGVGAMLGKGNLGNVARSTPEQTSNITDIRTVVTSSTHTFAIKTDGTVYAWGTQAYGEFGNGATTTSYVPVAIPLLQGSTAIATGQYHTLSLKPNGTVYAAGSNDYGQLGNDVRYFVPHFVKGIGCAGNLPLYPTVPILVTVGANGTITPNTDQSVIEGGNITFTFAGNSGYMPYELLIDGVNVPDSIAGGSYTFKNVNATHTIEVTFTPGSVITVIPPDAHGIISPSTNQLMPLGASKKFTFTALYGYTVSQLLIDGINVPDSIPYGSYTFKDVNAHHTIALTVEPVPVTPIVMISAHHSHSLSLKADGTVYAWGTNNNGQLGDGTTTNRNCPVPVGELNSVISIAAGFNMASQAHSLALKADGTVWAWGYNGTGQLGDGTSTRSLTPVQVSNLTGITAIAAGSNHSLALRYDGTVWAWGYNGGGKLGDGTTTNRSTPVQVANLTGVVAIVAGFNHNLALKADGTVWAWGSNMNGQLGDGTNTNRSTPVQVANLTGITAIAAGTYHNLARKADGTVWVWGEDGFMYGLWGNGRSDGLNWTPVQISAFSNVVSIATSNTHCFAIHEDGTVYAWGDNSKGQIGDGTTSNRRTPTVIPDFDHVIAMAAGETFSLALKEDGTVWSWGVNNTGQLGNGTASATNVTTPQQVKGVGCEGNLNLYPTFTITVTEGENGTITPAGTAQTVTYGRDRTFTFTPDACYRIDSVLVDGIHNPAAAASGSYTFTNVTEDHSFRVTFKRRAYTIRISTDDNGTIWSGNMAIPNGAGLGLTCSPSGTFEATLTFTPNTCYEIDSVLVDGVHNPAAAASGTYTFENVTEHHTFHVTFKIKTYTVTVSAGEHGTITPNGNVTVNCGANQTFTFAPDACYEVDSLLIDGENVPDSIAGGSYTFHDITENHTVRVTFKIKTYTLTASAGEHGAITPDGTTTLNCGADQTFTFTPDACYEIESVLVDGVHNPAAATSGSYTFENITENHTFRVTFKIKTYTVTASAGDNGTITPSGNRTVNCGTNQRFTFAASSNYEVSQLLIDGVNRPDSIVGGSYTFVNITAPHTIAVTFKPAGTGIADLTANAKINVYPNPTNGQLRITNYESSMGEIGVYDVVGRKQKAESAKAEGRKQQADGEIVIDISHLPSGIYFLRVGMETVKVVKQ